MKKAIYLKSIFLLCLLLAGVVNAHAEDYNYEWEKVTDLSTVTENDVVLLVDESNGFALSKFGQYDLRRVELAVSDGKVSVPGNVTASMKWIVENPNNNSFSFKNGDEYLWGSWTTPSVSVSSTSSNATNVFVLEDYRSAGGKMYYEGGYTGGSAYSINYLCWSQNSQLISIEESTEVRFSLYKKGEIKEYVKWKMVNGLDVVLNNDDVVVIADQNSAKAMSNDKKDKEPDAVAVNLNDSKDRILGDVAEKVQWTFTNVGGDYHFAVGEKNLYADSEGLKVGSETTNNGFSFSNNDNGSYMGINIDNTLHIAGVDASMFSNVWKLVTEDDDLAKNTQSVIFKKIVDRQKVVTITMAENYFVDINEVQTLNLNATITGADFSAISWTSSDTDVATVANGIVTLKKRGSVVITARVNENDYHDKASAKCTVIIDDSSLSEPGSTASNPLSVADAKKLAETGKVTVEGYSKEIELQPGVNYYIKGKVSKVNSGMMAMFGDMDFGEMMGSMGGGTSIGGGGTGTGSGGTSSFNFEDSMDDMDFDMEDMEDSGFDMSSMGFDMSSLGFDLSAMFGTSDKVTYYISDDGTKDGQMKVVNGCGTLKGSTSAMEFNPIPKLSPGDCVVVCGPLVYTEDTSMFSGMMGGNSSDEPKKSGKVDEMNYLAVYDPTLLVEDKEIYVNKTLESSDVYSIDNYFDYFSNQMKIIEGMTINEATFKSSDEEIAKWDEDSKKIVGVNEGKAKITVKVKVVLQEADDQADPKVEEKSYTMKRKFKVIVKTRDLLPAGYYDGEWELTTKTDDLKEGTRLVLVGTRVKDGNETDYMMVENNAMMGGGKNGSKIEFDEPTIPSSTVINKKGLEVVLEKDKNDANFWMLNVGEDENGNKLYLYASDSSKNTSTEDNPTTENDPTTEDEDKPKFDVSALLEMFMPSSGLKVGTMDKVTADSLKATISIDNKIATIKYDKISRKDDKSIIMLSSSFDMGEMMNMFGGNKKEEGGNNEQGGGNNEQGGGNNEQGGGSSTGTGSFNMDSFDMFMASFNTKKPGDEQEQTGEDGETKAPKCFMPRIYRFVPDESFNITFDTKNGTTEWRTIVTYKDVQVPNNVEAYIVAKVTPEDDKSVASLWPVKQLKGGEPYLLHTSLPNSYAMTLLTPYEPDKLKAPKGNLLKKSDRKTSGTTTSSTVYVLANKPPKGYGFYRWTGDDLGAGRVYLPVGATVAGAHEYCGFFVDETGEATAIESIDDFKANVGPFYDLQGRRVDNPSKGIYIVNGKKVIVK